jgi:hypothetical protein
MWRRSFSGRIHGTVRGCSYARTGRAKHARRLKFPHSEKQPDKLRAGRLSAGSMHPRIIRPSTTTPNHSALPANALPPQARANRGQYTQSPKPPTKAMPNSSGSAHPAHPWRIWLRLLAATLIFAAFEALLFHTDLYRSIIEPARPVLPDPCRRSRSGPLRRGLPSIR